jgi:sugar lactone lactonase YvrE
MSRRGLTWSATLVWACLTPAAAASAAEAPPLIQQVRLSFSLPRSATTSAGVYAKDGRLIRTLWRGDALAAGAHQRSWDGLDDKGQRATEGEYEVKLIHHRISYVWEGVIGNSSLTLSDPQVHRAYLPPASIAISGSRAYYAVGYNEQQDGIHGFDLSAPQRNTRPMASKDPFVSYAMVAVDATRLYWANVGGVIRTNFVGAYELQNPRPARFATGVPICLRTQPNATACYEQQQYQSVIDLHTEASEAPTGLAVQHNGRVLAVAHGGKDVIRLFDKIGGQLLHEIALPLARGALNQIAMSADGELWVISGEKLLRYTDLERQPKLVATLEGLTRPLALATSLVDPDSVWVAEGGSRQQIRRFDKHGQPDRVIGLHGGYATDPEVRPDKLCFMGRDRREQTALAVAADNTLWVVDACNNRMLRFRTDAGTPAQSDAQVAYLPAFYSATVDHGNPRRVFANFLEFEVPTDTPLVPGRSGKLVRNWLGGLPLALVDKQAFNGLFGGLTSVETLSNGRTYGLLAAHGRQFIVELPSSGPLRVVKAFGANLPNTTGRVMYENGDLGYAVTGAGSQTVLRLRLAGFDNAGDPVWPNDPVTLATVPTQPGTPYYRGAFSGMPPRFPLTASGKVVFFDQSVVGNEGFHLGAAEQGGRRWLWQASPTGALDGKGSFQTKAIDGWLQYGGNAVWAHGRHIVYGYHGEFYKDMRSGQVGQASQFMHFDESGLFIGQFGRSLVPPTAPSQPGMSGNAFSPTLVRIADRLHLFHNDESAHGGVHRWRIDGWDDVQELRGTGRTGGSIELR